MRTIDLVDDQTNMASYQFSSLSNWMGSGDRLQDVYNVRFLVELLGSKLPESLAKPLKIKDFIASSYSARLDRKLQDQVQFLFQARPDECVAPETVSTKLRDSLVALASQACLKEAWNGSASGSFGKMNVGATNRITFSAGR